MEPVLVLEPSSVSRLDLPGLVASKQQASKHTRNRPKSDLCRGAADWAKFFVDNSYGCEVQSHKVRARNSTVAARNGCHKWWS